MRRTKEGWDPPYFLAYEQHLVSRLKSIRSSVSGYAKICVITWSFDASNEESDSSKNLGDHHLAVAHADRPQCALLRCSGLLIKPTPAVHAFNMTALSAMHAEWLAPMIGIA